MGWAELLTMAGQHGIKMAADNIRKGAAKPAGDPAKGPGEAGCPACGVHREMAEAERLLAGVLRAWGDEPAPPERRAIVLLVEQILEDAPKRLAEIHDSRPEVQAALVELKRCISQARYELPGRGDLARRDWERAHEAVGRCWEMADNFAGVWFRPPAADPPPVDDLKARLLALPPEDRQKLLQDLAD